MYFPVDEVTRKMEYYIGNRGDERNWNKRTPSWDVLSSEIQCRLNMEGLYSHPIPFHFIPALGRGKFLEWVDRTCHTYMYMYMFGFQKTFIIVCLSYRLQASTEVLCTFGTVLLHICTGRGWCRNSRGAEWWRLHRWCVLGLGLEVWGPGGLGAGRSRGRGLGLGASAGGLLAVTLNV